MRKLYRTVRGRTAAGFDRIFVTETAKFRYRAGSTLPDPWILLRKDVPALSEAEWWDTPGPEWIEIPVGDAEPVYVPGAGRPHDKP